MFIYFHMTYISQRLIVAEPSGTLYCMTVDLPNTTYSLMSEQIEMIYYHMEGHLLNNWPQFITGQNNVKPIRIIVPEKKKKPIGSQPTIKA